MMLPILLMVSQRRNPHAISTILKTSGHSIDISETLDEVIPRVQKLDYGAAILDLGQTDLNTLKVLRFLIDLDPRLPVIVLSHRIDRDERFTFLANGAYACLPPTCSIDTLSAVLQRALSFKELAVKAASLERALNDTEERLLAMTNSTPDAIIHADDRGNITSLNKAACNLFRYSEQELVGKALTQLMPIQYRDAHQKGLARIQTTGASKLIGTTLEFRGLRKDGSEFPMEMSLSTWHSKERRYYSGIIRNITNRKEKETRLKTQTEQLRRQAKLLDLVHVLVRNLNDEIIFWNTGTGKLYGWPKPQAIGKVSHLLLQTIFPEPLDDIKKAVFEKGTWDGELIHTKQDGSQIVVASHWEVYRDHRGEPIAIVEINNDLTSIKHAEKCQRIHVDVNFALSSAKNLKEAAPSILQHMGEVGDWDFAYLWRCSRQRIETGSREALWVNTTRLPPDICRVIDQITGTPSHLAMPGLLLKTEQYVWLTPGHQGPESDHIAFFEKGLREVFGIPIRNQHTIYGGIVFGSQGNHTPDSSYSEAFVNAGFTLGQFIDHQIHEEQIAKLNECLLNFGKDVHVNINSLVVLCGELFDATCANYSRLEGDRLRTVHQWLVPPNVIGPDPGKSPPCSDGVRRGEHTPVVLRNLSHTPHVLSDPWIQEQGIQTFMGQTILVEGQCTGVLSLYFQWDGVPNDCDKQLIGIIANALAVEEERRKTEQTLQRSYDDTKQLLSSLPGAVLIVGQDFLVEYANDLAGKFFSVDPRSIVGENLKTVIPLGQARWDQLTGALLHVTQKRNAYQGPQEFELDNRSYQYRAFSTILQTYDQSKIGLFIWDITREKDLQEHLMQSEKLAGMGTLVTGMAHEVNNPAQAILSMGEIIQTGDDLQQIRDLAGDIIRHARHIGTVVQNFSSYARPSSLDGMQRVNVNHRLVEAVKLVQLGKQPGHIEVIQDFQQVPLISCSQVEIDQAFINLISNAMDAMSGSGVLTLRTHLKHNAIAILISDTGAGIPADLMGMIFLPFFTTKSPGQGTGLGLSIVHRIITKYRGFIEVESQVGQGTTFTVTIPVEAS